MRSTISLKNSSSSITWRCGMGFRVWCSEVRSTHQCALPVPLGHKQAKATSSSALFNLNLVVSLGLKDCSPQTLMPFSSACFIFAGPQPRPARRYFVLPLTLPVTFPPYLCSKRRAGGLGFGPPGRLFSHDFPETTTTILCNELVSSTPQNGCRDINSMQLDDE